MGWLCEWNDEAKYKAIDFAGGLVVHISSGVSALVMAILIGKRRGFPDQPMPPHNLTYTCIGTGLLWIGWFGFNGGSELACDGRALNAVFATHLAASAGEVDCLVFCFVIPLAKPAHIRPDPMSNRAVDQQAPQS